MDTKHTPGPWRIGDAGATVFGPKTEAPSPVRIATVTNNAIPSDAQRANARLIAAAPDGLQAAINALQAADEMGIECPGADGLRAFIAKATGNPA